MKLYENYWQRRRDDNMRPRRGLGRGRGRRFYDEERSGRMDGSQYGWTRGGRGQNRTDECRHPDIKKNR